MPYKLTQEKKRDLGKSEKGQKSFRGPNEYGCEERDHRNSSAGPFARKCKEAGKEAQSQCAEAKEIYYPKAPAGGKQISPDFQDDQ